MILVVLIRGGTKVKMAAPHLSGYQCEFVDSVEDYECPLCLHVTREPSLTSCCGQHFCQTCINRILTDQKPCPLCKASGFTVFFDKKQKRRVVSLKVVCSEKASGCDWVGSLGDLDSHVSVANGDCQFVSVNCSNNCVEIVYRKLLATHLANDCLKRPYSCKYCQLKSTYEEIHDKHTPVCTKYPVPCPNKCQTDSLERGQLQQHIRECPLQEIDCELKELGCNVKVPRKDISKHMENIQSHFRLMTAHALKTNEQVRSLQQQATGLQQQQATTLKKLTDTEDKLLTTQRQLEESKRENHDLKDRVERIETKTTSVQFTFNGYSEYKGKGKTWTEGPEFYTSPTRYRMKVNLYFGMSTTIYIKLTNLPSEHNDRLQWPMKCTMTVTMFNQAGDHDHYVHTRDSDVEKGKYNYAMAIVYNKIDNSPRGVQYLRNDSLKFRVDVRLRD